MPHQLRPSDLAREAGLTAQQIRNLESAGLLPPAERTAAGQRIYTERHRLALRLERTMIRAGFNGIHRRAIMHAAHANDPDAALQLVVERFVALDGLRRQAEHAIERASEQPVALEAGRDRLRIGAAARLIGVTSGALRHWELEGLIKPGRDVANGYRLYNGEMVQRAALIARLVDLGFGMPTLRGMTHSLDQDRLAPREAIATLLAPVRDQIRACAEATSLLWHYLEIPV